MYAMYGLLESIFGFYVLCIYLEFYRIGLLCIFVFYYYLLACVQLYIPRAGLGQYSV